VPSFSREKELLMPPATLPASQVAVALRQSPLAPLRRLRINETDASVTITGIVPTYYLKQMAQETVMPVLGGRALLNHVTVAN
jgi:hypothetical protein